MIRLNNNINGIPLDRINNSKEGLKAAVNKKVKAVFEQNIGAIILFATVTLPIFFIAWPCAVIIAFEDAKDEVKGNVALKRLTFIHNLSKKLGENPNGNPEKIFDDFVEENGLNYNEIFSNNAKKTDLIKLAFTFKNSEKNLEQKDAIVLWKDLIKLENKIRSLVNSTNTLNSRMNAEPIQNVDISLSKAIKNNSDAATQYRTWRSYAPSNGTLTNSQIIRKITNEHKINIDMLNQIISYVVNSQENMEGKSSNYISGKQAEVRLKILEILEKCKTNENTSNYIDSLGYEAENKGQLEILNLVLATKLIQSANNDSSTTLLKNAITSVVQPFGTDQETKETWECSNGETYALPAMLNGEWSRRCCPISLDLNPTKKKTDLAIKDANNANLALNSWVKRGETKKIRQLYPSETDHRSLVADALSTYYQPVVEFIDSVAEEEKLSPQGKKQLEMRLISSLTQEYPNFIAANFDKQTIMENPLNKVGLKLSTSRFNPIQLKTIPSDRELAPITFSYDKRKKQILIGYTLYLGVQDASFYRKLPLTIKLDAQLTLDLTKPGFSPICETLRSAPIFEDLDATLQRPSGSSDESLGTNTHQIEVSNSESE